VADDRVHEARGGVRREKGEGRWERRKRRRGEGRRERRKRRREKGGGRWHVRLGTGVTVSFHENLARVQQKINCTGKFYFRVFAYPPNKDVSFNKKLLHGTTKKNKQ
jgi:hypothetical protein